MNEPTNQSAETWVLSIAGLIGTVLVAQAQWGPFDIALGIIILLILRTVPSIESHSESFQLAYNALFALGIVIAVAPILLYLSYLLELVNIPIIQISIDDEHETGLDWSFLVTFFEAFLVIFWLIVFVVLHQKIGSK